MYLQSCTDKITYVLIGHDIHTPSQASTRNSSSEGIRSLIKNSGSRDTSCSVGGLPSTFLYSKSPRARETAKDPLTLCIITVPPAFCILARSGSFEGLWSCVTRAGLPLTQKTPLLSPQLASMRNLSVIRAQTAVVPDLSSPLATSGIFLNFSSSSRKPLSIPFCTPRCNSSPGIVCSCCNEHVKSSFVLIQSNKWLAQCAETRDPACPSKTANQDTVSFWSGIPMIAECASS